MLGSSTYPISVLHALVAEIPPNPFNSVAKILSPVSGVVLVFIPISLSVFYRKYYDGPVHLQISGYFF
jgi:hypothetical protein